eukprot:scaffold41824_cov69-Phaeocystis_antarctica.AAC.2
MLRCVASLASSHLVLAADPRARTPPAEACETTHRDDELAEARAPWPAALAWVALVSRLPCAPGLAAGLAPHPPQQSTRSRLARARACQSFLR